MDEIDVWDMPGFLKLRAWKAVGSREERTLRRRYIDEAWPDVKPDAQRQVNKI